MKREKKPPRPKRDGEGTSEEYRRFESLMRRLVSVPKKVISEREAKRQRG